MQTLDVSLGKKNTPVETLQRYTNNTDLVSLQEPIIKDLEDLQDVQIFASIFIGEDQQEFEMIFDTGSNWLWVNSDDCINCPYANPQFQDEQSSSYENVDNIFGTNLYYGTGSVHGYKSQDQVCITPEFCSPDFTFIVVDQQNGLDRLASSGIVGMSPNHFEAESDLFIEKMKQTGAIDESIFSLSIGMNDQQSKITFGGYDLEDFATGPITWHNIDPYSVYWQVTMSEFHLKYGPHDTRNQNYRRDVIVDSGTSFVLLPTNDLYDLLDGIEQESGMLFIIDIIPYTWCSEDQYNMFPDMRFTIDNSVYFLPKESYVIREYGMCTVMIMNNPLMSQWILGLNFFGNYYTVFDQENLKVGFAPSIHAADSM